MQDIKHERSWLTTSLNTEETSSRCLGMLSTLSWVFDTIAQLSPREYDLVDTKTKAKNKS